MSYFNEKMKGKKEFDSQARKILPDGVTVHATIDNIEWKAKDNIEHLAIRWLVHRPEEHAGHMLFQSLHLNAVEAKRRANAVDFFTVIDNIAGNKLSKSSDPELKDGSLQKVIGTSAALKIKLLGNEDNPFEYIAAIASTSKPQKQKKEEVKEEEPAIESFPEEEDDDVPF